MYLSQEPGNGRTTGHSEGMTARTPMHTEKEETVVVPTLHNGG